MKAASKKLLAGCAVSLVSAWGAAALADEDTGFYVGGGLGASSLEIDGRFVAISDEVRFELDDDDVGYKLFAGWQFLPFLGVEGGYVDFGEVDDNSGGVRSEASADGWDIFLVGNLPLGMIDLFAKAGVIAYNVDVEVRSEGPGGPFSKDNSSEDFAYGAGAAVELGSFAVRAEYEYFDVSEFDTLSLWSIGLSYQF